MTTTRPTIPQGNLKDRIAALQQRNVSASNAHDHSPPPAVIPTSRLGTGAASTSLREKIASFEKKGAVPAPRGSFGIGAPPADDGSSRRRGELYGNRVPGLSKPVAVPLDLPSVSNARRRTVSSSVLLTSPPRLDSRPTSPTSTESISDSLSDVEDSPSSSPRVQRRYSRFGDLTSSPTPRFSLSISHSNRRSVSDIPPFRIPTPDVPPEPPVPEVEEEAPQDVQTQLISEEPDQSPSLVEEPRPPEVEVVQSPPVAETPTIVVSPDPSPIPVVESPPSPTPLADVVDLTNPLSPDPLVQIPEADTLPEPVTLPIPSPSPPSDPEPLVSAPEVSPSDLPYLQSQSATEDTGEPEEDLTTCNPEVDKSDDKVAALVTSVPPEEPGVPNHLISTEVPIEAVQSSAVSVSDSRPLTPQLESPVVSTEANVGTLLPVEDTISSPAISPSVDTPSTGIPSSQVSPPSEYHSLRDDVSHPPTSPLSTLSSPSPLDDGPASTETVPTPQDIAFASPSPSPKPSIAEQEPKPEVTDDSVILDESFVKLAAPIIALETTHSIIVDEPPDAIISPPEPSPEISAAILQAPETPVATRPLSLVSDDEASADMRKSLALDTSEVVIVSEPPHMVSPNISRGVLVPAPSPNTPSPRNLIPPPVPDTLPSPAVIPPEISPSASAMVRSKSARNTFYAVVHDKVRETAGEPLPPLPSAQDFSSASLKTPRAQQFAPPEPLQDVISPGLGELAALVADAAMLEEQLSGFISPKSKGAAINPVVTVDEPMTPVPITPTPTILDRERRPPQDVPDTVGEGEHDQAIEGESQLVFREPEALRLALPPKRSASLSAKSVPTPTRTTHPPFPVPPTPVTPHRQEHHFPSTPYRQEHVVPPTIDEVGPPPPPPKSPPRHRRPFKLSMPGAYPRGSYSSSEDSSNLVSNPPSPGTHDHESLRSDASSVKSSSKSLKSPKGLSRATSFAERFWNRGKKKKSVNGDDDGHLSPGAHPQRAPSPTHLSPYNVPPIPPMPRNLANPLQQRPPSWVSVSTMGSKDESFDIYDSFPSVPGQGKQPHSSGHGHQYKSESPLSPEDYGAPTTTPAYPNGHQNQRF